MTTGDKLHKCSPQPIRNLQLVRGFNYQSMEYHIISFVYFLPKLITQFMYYALNPVFYYNFMVCTFCRTFQKIYPIPPPQKGVFSKTPVPFGNASYASCIALNCLALQNPHHPQEISISSVGEGGGGYEYFLELYILRLVINQTSNFQIIHVQLIK